MYDLTGKRPVRSADDHSDLVMMLAWDHSVRGGLTGARGGEGRDGEEALLIEERQVGGEYLSGEGDAFAESVQVTEGCGEG